MSLGRGVRPPLRMWQRGHRERLGARPAAAEKFGHICATCFSPSRLNPDSNGLRGQHISCAGRERLLCVHTEAAKISRGADMFHRIADCLAPMFGGLAAHKTFNPTGLPLPDDAEPTHPKVTELRDLVSWSEAMVWCSPERHGAMTGIMKAQIDWIPLSLGAVRPTQGKVLALMQVNGGSQSFNAVNQMRILGRWMRCITIPNQSSLPKAFQQFDESNRMKPSPFYNRMVDVMEELMKFTILTRSCSSYLTDRYSERVEAAEKLIARVNTTD